MARIFTVEFYYKAKLQSALVSVGMIAGETSFHIQLHDKALDKVFVTANFRYKGINGYKKLEQYAETEQRDLLEAIGEEIEKHIKKAGSS